MSVSISSNKNTYERTYGVNSNVKTNGGRNVNVKSGVTVSKTNNGAYSSVGVSADTDSFNVSSKSGNSSVGISAPKASAEAGVTVGGWGGSASAKASLTEVSGSKSFNVFGAKVTVSGEAGVGVAVGGKAGVGSNSVSAGAKTPVLPGVYVGANIDISL